MTTMIAIEGLDGSGKETQTNLLKKYLVDSGHTVGSISFPRYGQTSAVLVEEYLHGAFGTDPSEVNAYGASSFFAMDRFASYLRDWKKAYETCDYFIADRYVTSNTIHQCSKLPSGEWEEYLDWLFEFEYRKLKLPKPDKVFYLHLDVLDSQRLLNKRYKNDEYKKDIHEHNIDYLLKSQSAAEFCSDYCGWERIDCMKNSDIRSIEDIHNEIVQRLGL